MTTYHSSMILPNEREMDATASDGMIWGLVARLERDGHYLTPSLVDKIHAIISDAKPDERTMTGNMTEAAKAIRERIERER